MNYERRARIFFYALVLTTMLTVWCVGREVLEAESTLLLIFWLSGFGFLFFNVVYLAALSILSLIVETKPLPEVYVDRFPNTALVYCIRNEESGLFERMKYSFEGNRLPGVDFWILSDSSPDFEEQELALRLRLEECLGRPVNYRRRSAPVERKQGNLHEFLASHPTYEFVYICDADSMVPAKTLLTIFKKARHPHNQDIAIFQTLIKTAHAKTYYAKFEGIASETSQQLYFKTIQSFFGRSISFGHQHLIRTDLFRRINLPKGLLSHDNWDTALLDEQGARVAFLHDVVTFDEAPSNYLESRKREARWAQGTLQGFPLIYRKGIGSAIRFLSFYGIYCYLMQPVFLAWLLLGFISQSFAAGELLTFKTDALWFGVLVNKTLTGVFILSLTVNFFHKLTVVRCPRDFKRFLYELALSTLIYAGNFLYGALDITLLPLRKLIWKPMKKNPFEEVSVKSAFQYLYPGTLAGIVGIWYLLDGTPYPHLASLPIFLSLALSIPIVYYASKTFPNKETRLA